MLTPYKTATTSANAKFSVKLSESGMKFVLPVLQDKSANANMITSADFGCNQYES